MFESRSRRNPNGKQILLWLCRALDITAYFTEDQHIEAIFNSAEVNVRKLVPFSITYAPQTWLGIRNKVCLTCLGIPKPSAHSRRNSYSLIHSSCAWVFYLRTIYEYTPIWRNRMCLPCLGLPITSGRLIYSTNQMCSKNVVG